MHPADVVVGGYCRKYSGTICYAKQSKVSYGKEVEADVRSKLHAKHHVVDEKCPCESYD